jgi:H+/Cl- antiporter ClcA
MSERLRDPQPLLRRRLPSRRGALEQANATSDTPARLTRRFWFVLVVSAVAAGVLGIAMMGILHAVQHLAFDYRGGDFGSAVEHVDGSRRVLVLALAGLVLGPAWFLLRRRAWSGSTDVDDVVWTRAGGLSLPRSLLTASLSEVAVGAGASIGREAAPKLLGGAVAGHLGQWARLDADQVRLLIACGAGAGLACVYNVPLAGALLTAEVLIGQLTLPVVLPALLASLTATAVAWTAFGTGPTYPGVDVGHTSPAVLLVAVLMAPPLGLLAVALTRLIGWTSHHQVRGRWLLVAPAVVFTALGALAVPLPLLLGNGKDLTRVSWHGAPHLAILTLLLLALLKPLATAACLGAGANGGLLTPVLSTGAALGAALGLALGHLGTGAPGVATCAMLGAAALTGAATQAPLTALALVLELTGSTAPLLGPLVAAVALATVTARQVDGYSIYTARLASAPGQPLMT